jgi:hypothetical protein
MHEGMYVLIYVLSKISVKSYISFDLHFVLRISLMYDEAFLIKLIKSDLSFR